MKNRIALGELDNRENVDLSLWMENTPARFWQTKNIIEPNVWQEAFNTAMNLNESPLGHTDIDQFLFNTLGEGRYGLNHWELSNFNIFYWLVKPYVPNPMMSVIKSFVNKNRRRNQKYAWPIEDKFVNIMWETMKQVLQITGNKSIKFRNFWPDWKRFSLILTHDVETFEKLDFMFKIADLEEKYGFRSSVNIVGENLPDDLTLLHQLSARGFEIGIHGWQHSALAFKSRSMFKDAVKNIDTCMKRTGAVGIRFPLNLRHPLWMQDLNIEYDLSFFDTDSFEPIPGGTMSIWPFRIGRFIELPATLVQDNTLVNQLGEKTPDLWFTKVEFLRRYHGMVLLNSHPDYLVKDSVWKVYEEFLQRMYDFKDCWSGLPRDAARWWKYRTDNIPSGQFPDSNFSEAILINNQMEITDNS